jgi:hypothetical protein
VVPNDEPPPLLLTPPGPGQPPRANAAHSSSLLQELRVLGLSNHVSFFAGRAWAVLRDVPVATPATSEAAPLSNRRWPLRPSWVIALFFRLWVCHLGSGARGGLCFGVTLNKASLHDTHLIQVSLESLTILLCRLTSDSLAGHGAGRRKPYAFVGRFGRGRMGFLGASYLFQLSSFYMMILTLMNDITFST